MTSWDKWVRGTGELTEVSCRWCVLKSLRRVQLWDSIGCAHQASLFMGFSRQAHWSGLPCPPPGHLPDPGTEPRWYEVKWSEVKLLSCVRLFVTPWTVAYKAPLSMGLSRQEYWSGLPFPSPGDLPDPGIKPRSPTLQAEALLSEPPRKPQVIRHPLKILPHHQIVSKWMSFLSFFMTIIHIW